jgi:hypothetical protein
MQAASGTTTAAIITKSVVRRLTGGRFIPGASGFRR